MRYVALIALLAPLVAVAQTAQTNCYSGIPGNVQCTTMVQPPYVGTYVNPNAFGEAFERAQRMGLQRQQAQIASEQQQNLQMQNELLRRQLAQQQHDPQLENSRRLDIDTAVLKTAYLDVLSEQPQRQLNSERGIGDAAAARAKEILGRNPHPQALINTAAEMHEQVLKALEKQ